MALSVVFGLIVTLGFTFVLAAIFLMSRVAAQNRVDLIVRRFTGEIRPESGSPDEEEAIALRRDAAGRGWLGLLPVPGSDDGIVPRRVTVVLFLGITTTTTLMLHLLASLGVATGIACGLILSLIGWIIQARRLRRRRAAAIEEALPEAMDLIVRSLKIGLPVGTAVQAAGRELIGPIAEEFSDTSARISYGQEPVGALRDMANRTGSQGLSFFAAAVAIQSTTGGNLAEILERLANIERGRQQLRRKVRSITSEAKWSGRFLSFFPLGATAMLLSVNPSYFSEISGQPFFIPMLGAVGGLLALNILFMHWLVKVE
ncbi:hypothetical protein HOY34_17385 [Xinfangfangia sp. D13-10-4-6]|uniref:type II secretion system F family protein n=1 Tax=Pseudogemmobacter hezensis TaxID=2737662 RepID=UPI0015542FB0|nr:type II secretion system F family protein [Pseudogemmobacter hezensis]NPD16968.1 hypothetical protein [Pseudogemmobacter hezensis]